MVDDVFGIAGTTQAGNFLIERPVAEGGFAVVYRAFHTAFRAPVALKCLKVPEGMTIDQQMAFLGKFREEGELLFRLSAAIPEVVRPLQVDALAVPDGRFVPFLALEWLEGDPLDKVIDGRSERSEPPLDLRELVTILTPVARALAKAHAFPDPAGTIAIIHRDLKPENIFLATVGGSKVTKILDFGIATVKKAAAQASGKAAKGEQLAAFSAGYAAPEQWAPQRYGEAGPWTDVWGLTVTMVEALAGAPQHAGDDYQALRATALDEQQRPTPRSRGVNIGQKVDQVFERALAVDPRVRIGDITTFWTDLERAMGLDPSIKPDPVVGPRGETTLSRRSAGVMLSGPTEKMDFELAANAPASLASGEAPYDLETHLVSTVIDQPARADRLKADLAFDPHLGTAPRSVREPSAPPPVAPLGKLVSMEPEGSLREQLADMPRPLLLGLGGLVLLSVALLAMGTFWAVLPLLLAGGGFAAYRFTR